MPESPASPDPSSAEDADATRIVKRDAEPEAAAQETSLPEATAAPAAATGSAAPKIEPGQILGHTYEIEALLARGGMGEVYRARHAELGSLHAIKIILPELVSDTRIVTMFKEEAKKLRKLRNDAIVAYEGLFRDEFGRRYLVMEYVEGVSLARLIKDRPLTPAEVRQLRDRVASGLAAAHDKGIYHRDISPDNIILVAGDMGSAKIIDFGIAKSADPGDRTVIGQDFAGKYSYVSPEQLGAFGGAVDGRSDIYSLGLVLVAAARGRPLDMGNSPISVVEKRQSVPDLGDIPEELRDELRPLLEPNPADRPQSMRELPGGGGEAAARVAPLWAEPAPAAPVPQPAAAPPRRRSAVPLVAAAVISFLVVLGAGAGYYFLTQPSPPTELAATAPAVAPPVAPEAAASPSRAAPPPAVAPAPTVAAAPKAASSPPAAAAPAPPPTAAQPETVAATAPSPAAKTTLPAAAPVPPPAVAPPLAAGPKAATKPVQTAALIAAPKLRDEAEAKLHSLLGTFQCAELTASLSDDLAARITGFVGRAEDLEKLRRGLAAIDGIRPVADKVAVYAWPHCAYVKLLAGDASAANAADAPRLQFNKPSKVYKNGDKLTVKATAGKLRDGYLYVDYIDNGGTVVHIFPTPLRKNNFVKAGQQVSLGTTNPNAKGDERVYEISEPFGPNLIIAIFSPKPLFQGEEAEAEPADQYLRSLQAKLASVATSPAGKELASSYSFIDTIP